mmetsp:Transcript_109013/g.314905  ORF Transcript_109013/g.314905 Transcript_109013/m.314905 type:complete len:216 (+) Transcript_109013:819-1466(+)
MRAHSDALRALELWQPLELRIGRIQVGSGKYLRGLHAPADALVQRELAAVDVRVKEDRLAATRRSSRRRLRLRCLRKLIVHGGRAPSSLGCTLRTASPTIPVALLSRTLVCRPRRELGAEVLLQHHLQLPQEVTRAYGLWRKRVPCDASRLRQRLAHPELALGRADDVDGHVRVGSAIRMVVPRQLASADSGDYERVLPDRPDLPQQAVLELLVA